MTRRNQLKQNAEAPRDRLSSLSAAILRISTSLDVETVLREVVESARELTDARYGVIATVDEAGLSPEFVISGMPADEERELAAWPEAPQLFEHFRELKSPIRVTDLPQYVRSLGYSAHLMLGTNFQGMPMRHRGMYIGTFFLAGKEGGEGFTDEDEEVLVLFAAQAAIAIANARAHRDERRARADLEALIETSPIGVTVFDAKTAQPLLFNLEARRIVERLDDSECTAFELSKLIKSRYADGREVTVEQLIECETLRAEEMELSVPDGRSVRVLVNATPIHSEDGEVESVVVTTQDLAPLEEQERLRAEFLSMVSHELRAPLTSIKGATATLLGELQVLERAEVRQFIRIVDMQADHMRGLISDLLDAGRIDSGTLSVDPKPVDVATLVDRARTTFLSAGGRHAIPIDLPSDLPLVMADERRIVQVLNNLFTNAALHSPESSPIEVGAVLDGIEVAVSVSDRGRGLTVEQLPHLFRRYGENPGVKRKPNGLGLGLVICKGIVEAHGGRIRAESVGPGFGSRFIFTLPVVGATGENAAPREFETGSRASGEAPQSARVLVVDDDPETLRYVRRVLAAAGYKPLVTGEPNEVAHLIRKEKPQLVLLDLVLPGADGIELLESVHEIANLPVIFISGYGRDETIARALESGAADYIVKPFSPTELTARVRAVLRREAEPEPFLLDQLSINYEQRRVMLAGRAVRLTPIEFELLCVLSRNAGRVMTYASLLRQVWVDRGGRGNERVRDFIKKLRRKLGEDAAQPVYIINERGVGYRMPKPGGR